MVTVVVCLGLVVVLPDQFVPGYDVDRGGGGGGAVPLLPQVLSQVQLAGRERSRRELAGLADVLDQGGGARGPGVVGAVEGGRGAPPPLVHRPSPGVHEEVGHCGGIQTKLAGDGDLHLLGRSFCFLKSFTAGRLLCVALQFCTLSLVSQVTNIK